MRKVGTDQNASLPARGMRESEILGRAVVIAVAAKELGKAPNRRTACGGDPAKFVVLR